MLAPAVAACAISSLTATRAGAQEAQAVSAPSGDARTYFEFQVEKPVVPMRANPVPRFPEAARTMDHSAAVLVQFVVDSAGRADMRSIRFLHSDGPVFEAAVREVLPRWRFTPAETGGRRVSQLVQLPFTWEVANKPGQSPAPRSRSTSE